jgi:polyhydroxybutyrate depolymerase
MRKWMESWLMLSICAFLFAAGAQRATSSASECAPFAAGQDSAPLVDSDQTITVAGVQRSYVLHIPPNYNGSTPLPLVFVLHGKGGSGKGIELTTRMSAKADAERFIVVYPNAIGNPAVWNAGLNAAITNGADDVGFMRELLNKLEGTLRIDRKRVYFCGFSSGAIMSYRLGAEMSDRLAAVGIVSGTIGAKQPNGSIREYPKPSEPLPIIVFHGKQDQTIFYDGGGVYANCLSVAESIAFWIKADGCASPPQQTTGQQGNLIKDDYDRCKGTAEVVLYTFVNGTHEWPKLQNNDAFNATDVVWGFFVRHARG